MGQIQAVRRGVAIGCRRKCLRKTGFDRGAVDELPAIAGMAYGAKILADRGLPDGVSQLLQLSNCQSLSGLAVSATEVPGA